jgi:hypothetical protein
MQDIVANTDCGNISVEYNMQFTGAGSQVSNPEGCGCGFVGANTMTPLVPLGIIPTLNNWSNIQYQLTYTGTQTITLPPGHYLVTSAYTGTGITGVGWTPSGTNTTSVTNTTTYAASGGQAMNFVFNDSGAITLTSACTGTTITSCTVFISVLPTEATSYTPSGAAISAGAVLASTQASSDNEYVQVSRPILSSSTSSLSSSSTSSISSGSASSSLQPVQMQRGWY